MTDIKDTNDINQQAMKNAVVDFNGKSTITKSEFSAWLAGYLGRFELDTLTPECISDIIGMVLKIEEPTKYIPSPNIPWPDQIKPMDPNQPFNPPMFPGPGPCDPINPTVPWPNRIWCGGDTGTKLDVSYKITSCGSNDITKEQGPTDGS